MNTYPFKQGLPKEQNASLLTSPLKGTCSSSKEYGCSFESTTQNAAHQRCRTLSQSVTHRLWCQFVDPGSLVVKTSGKVSSRSGKAFMDKFTRPWTLVAEKKKYVNKNTVGCFERRRNQCLPKNPSHHTVPNSNNLTNLDT